MMQVTLFIALLTVSSAFLDQRLISIAASIAARSINSVHAHQHKHRLYTCDIKSVNDSNTLQALDFDIWTHHIPLYGQVDVRTKSDQQLQTLTSKLSCVLKVDDVYRTLRHRKRGHRPRNSKEDDFFTDYQPYEAIVAKMKEWSRKYPHLTTFVPSYGRSHEGRDLPALIITDKRSNHQSSRVSSYNNSKSSSYSKPESRTTHKKMVWWNAGQHAREWISPATVMYLANTLLSHSSPPHPILTHIDIVITPMNNPDGYVTTFQSDRLWRKNRRVNDDGSVGVDLNRNWDEHWGQVGSSDDPRSETYQGPFAFSEPETNATAEFILSFPHRYAGIDFHSYGQLILRNWGHTTQDSQNENLLKQVGDGMSDIITRFSPQQPHYTSQKAADLYPASGCTDDWMAAKAKMAGWTIELRDTGTYGFELPPSEIVSVGQDMWYAMMYFLYFVSDHDIPPNQ